MAEAMKYGALAFATPTVLPSGGNLPWTDASRPSGQITTAHGYALLVTWKRRLVAVAILVGEFTAAEEPDGNDRARAPLSGRQSQTVPQTAPLFIDVG